MTKGVVVFGRASVPQPKKTGRVLSPSRTNWLVVGMRGMKGGWEREAARACWRGGTGGGDQRLRVRDRSSEEGVWGKEKRTSNRW